MVEKPCIDFVKEHAKNSQTMKNKTFWFNATKESSKQYEWRKPGNDNHLANRIPTVKHGGV